MTFGFFEVEYIFFDIAAIFALTAWSADGWHPWWGVFVALAAAALAFGFVAAASRGMRAITNRLFIAKTSAQLDAGTFGIRIDRTQPRSRTTLAWSEIEEITVAKADLYTVDCITLLIRTRENSVVVLDERMGGWETVVDALPTYLDCEPLASWFLDVAFPAFEPNPRQIYPWTPQRLPKKKCRSNLSCKTLRWAYQRRASSNYGAISATARAYSLSRLPSCSPVPAS